MGPPSNQRLRPGMFGNRTQPNFGFGTNSPAGNYAAAEDAGAAALNATYNVIERHIIHPPENPDG